MKISKKFENIILCICALVIILSIVLFFAIRSNNKHNFKFNEHLEESVFTLTNCPTNDVNSSVNISLKEVSYYILVAEANVNHTASLYNPDNMHSYWNLYIDNTFMKTIAKDTCLDMVIRDNIYYYEALSHDTLLTTAESQSVLNEAEYIYGNLTAKQVNNTELSLEDLYNIRYKIALATKYILSISSDNSNNSSLSKEELNVDGEYYNSLYESYNVEISNLWHDITLSDITIDIN